MSKAFTKEDDSGDEPALPEIKSSVSRGPNYITIHGVKALQTELNELLRVERPKVVETVSWAAGNGDRSENGDYIYGKKRLREIDRRVRYLSKRLENAVAIDPAEQGKTNAGKIVFGATVKVRDEDGSEKNYQIVGEDETNAKAGKISWISPVGKALIGTKLGDAIEVRTPGGTRELEIIEIIYE